jgi:proline iminopeptidase
MILIGLGAGGELAARYMSRYPERVAGVVLHSPTPLWDDRRFEYNFVQTGSPLGSVVSLEIRPFYAGLMALYGPKAAENLAPQDEISAWYTRSLAPAALVCARHVEQSPQFQVSFNYYVYVRTERSANDPPDPRPRLADNLTPVILLAAECDYIPWEVILQYHEALYNLKVFYFEDAGHMINLTRPDDMAAVIRAFLLKEEYPMEPYTGPQNPRPVVPGIGL